MKPTPGSLSPFQTSSSNHEEKNDNYVEYYVEGGEKMAEKTFDVNDSATKSNAYDVKSSTEPDATGTLAMNKEAGEGDYSTTANSRNNEPIKGSTTEPDEFHKAATCCDNACGKCTGPGCGCCADCKADVKKADTCDCGKEDCEKCMGMKKEAMPSASSSGSSDTSYTASIDEDEEDEEDEESIEKKEFSTARRKQLAREGKAMGDGSYPIESRKDVENAVKSWGRGGAKPEVKQHIIRRAKALNCMDCIPDDWKKDMKKSLWGGFFIPHD